MEKKLFMAGQLLLFCGIFMLFSATGISDALALINTTFIILGMSFIIQGSK
jgi:hypothetical protein